MNADGSEQINLTKGQGGRDPDWSPDGNQIVFSSSRDGNSEIYVMNADGTGQQNLTNTQGTDEHLNNSPTNWSPDGSQVVSVSTRNDKYIPEIYVINSDGSGLKNLANSPDLYLTSPAWCPVSQ